jgi:hypothetical protein
VEKKKKNARQQCKDAQYQSHNNIAETKLPNIKTPEQFHNININIIKFAECKN